MIEKSKILEAYNFRHACKKFDVSRKIPSEDIDFLIETFRLSPSSFGMEPWRLLIIKDESLKKELKSHCWNQNQIDSCSHLVVVISKTALVEDEEYIKKMFSRRPEIDSQEPIIKKIKATLKELSMNFITRYMYKSSLKSSAIYEWCSRQNYLASANMATSAAMIGIDSCFIEGFKKDKVEKTLALDSSKEEVSLLLPLGYRINLPKEKTRLEKSEFVEYR